MSQHHGAIVCLLYAYNIVRLEAIESRLEAIASRFLLLLRESSSANLI